MLSTIFTTAVIGTERGPRSVEGPDTNHRNRDTVPSMAAPGAGPECLYQGSWKKGPLPFPLDQPQALDNLQTRTGQRFPFVQAIVTYLKDATATSPFLGAMVLLRRAPGPGWPKYGSWNPHRNFSMLWTIKETLSLGFACHHSPQLLTWGCSGGVPSPYLWDLMLQPAALTA